MNYTSKSGSRVAMLLAASLAAGTAYAEPMLTSSDPGAADGAVVAIPVNNDLDLGSTNELQVGYQLEATDAGSLLYTYLGKEAGYTNYFWDFGSGCAFSTASTAVGTTCTTQTDSGVIDFGFLTSGGGRVRVLMNGEDFNLSSPMTFALQLVDTNVWNILLDDSGGNPNDKDFDDLGIRVVFTPHAVPEPGTLALLGLGMAGLGMMRRRRKAPAA